MSLADILNCIMVSEPKDEEESERRKTEQRRADQPIRGRRMAEDGRKVERRKAEGRRQGGYETLQGT